MEKILKKLRKLLFRQSKKVSLLSYRKRVSLLAAVLAMGIVLPVIAYAMTLYPTASYTTVYAGGYTTISWYTPNADICYMYDLTGPCPGDDCSSPIAAGGASGSVYTGPINGAKQYYLTCWNNGPANYGSGALYINVYPTTRTATTLNYFYASPASIPYSSNATLYYSGNAGTSGTGLYLGGYGYLSGWSGTLSRAPLMANTTYSIYTEDSYYGQVGPWNTTVTVQAPTAPTPAIVANPTTVGMVGAASALTWSAGSLHMAGQCTLTAPSGGAVATNFGAITGGTKTNNLYAANTVVNGWVYSMGGYNGSAYVSTVSRARASSDLTNASNWSAAASMPSSVAIFDKPLLIGSNLWSFGGVAAGPSAWSSAICYVPVDSTGTLGAWSCPASLPAGTAQGYADPIVIGDYIYRFGGYNYTTYAGPVASVSRAPVSSPSSWITYTNVLPQALYGQSVAVIGGYVYLFGGYNGSAYTNTVYRAPISSDLTVRANWVSGGVLPTTLVNTEVAVDADYAYIIGGYSASAAVNTIYKIPLGTLAAGGVTAGSWSSAGTLPIALNRTEAVIVNDKLTLMGGWQNGVYVNKVYSLPFNDGLSYTTPANLPWHTTGGTNSASTWPLAANTTYTLQCANSFGSNSASATVSMPSPPVPTITASPTTVDSAGTSTLAWSASNMYDSGQCTLTAPSGGATATNFGSITTGTRIANYYSVNAVVGGWAYSMGGYNGSAYVPTSYKAPASSDLANASNWSTVAAIPTSVALFDEPLYINGNLWNFGGVAFTSGGVWSSSICYVPVGSGTLGAWSCPASLPTGAAQGYSNPVIIGDYIYRFGGYNYTTYAGGVAAVSRAPLSSPSSWTNYTNVLPQTLYTQGVAVIGNYVYLFGGYNGSAYTNTIYRASISSDLTLPASWTSGGVLPLALGSMGIAVDGTYVYIIGGYNGSAAVKSIYNIPLATLAAGGVTVGSWGSWLTLPVARNLTKPLIVNDKLYLMGGWQNGVYANAVYSLPFNDGLSYTTPANLPWHVTGSPNQAVTWPLAANTTYALQCTNSAGSGSDSATVTIRDMCTDITGFQSALPPGCTGPVPSPSGTCIPAGDVYDGSACVPAPLSIDSFFGPGRVRSGNTAVLKYTVTSPPASCTIVGTNGFSTSVSPVNGVQGSVTTSPITSNTVFTLTCNGVSLNATVGTTPQFQEI